MAAASLHHLVVGVTTALLCCAGAGGETYRLRPLPEVGARQLVQKATPASATSFVVAATGGVARFPCGVASLSNSRALLYREKGATGESPSLLYDWPGYTTGRLSGSENNSVSEKSIAEASGLRALRYDPDVGFLASVGSFEAAGRYVCVRQTRLDAGGNGSAIQERRFLLHVLSGSPWGTDRPQIKSLCDEKCSTVALRCAVLVVRGSPLTIAWTKDNVSIDMSADPRLSVVQSVIAGEGLAAVQYTEHVSRLAIAPAVDSDSGSYECTATTFGSRRSATISVSVHASGGSPDGNIAINKVVKSTIRRGPGESDVVRDAMSTRD